jgi:hypothetical protein
MNRSRLISAVPALLLVLALPAAAQTLQTSAGETVDVEIKIVPFYAVDQEGKPVFDLRQDEIELRVDGQVVQIDSFDTPTAPAAAPATGTESAPTKVSEKDGSHPAAAQRRHVVLLFDTAFSRVAGFQKAQALARTMVQDAPGSDLLYLLIHDFKAGLKQELGPLTADAAGKAKMIERIRGLKPEIGQLDANANNSVDLIDRGVRKNGVPPGQNSAIYNALRTNSQAQLESTAVGLSQSMQELADQFQRIREPKLFVFLSQGIDPVLYWEGSDVGLQFSTDGYTHVKSYQFRGLHGLYDKPLQQLADSGAMSLFVNLDDKGANTDYLDTSMQHMALNSGGLYLGGADATQMARRVGNSTAAYYEAGFYLTEKTRTASRAKVEVVVKRPGVETWSAGALKTQETYRGLSDEARRLLIVDLVEGNIGDTAAQRSRSRVRLDYQNLPGDVLGRSEAGKTLLRYQMGWPRELAGHKVDLYNVVLVPARQNGSPNILRFDRRENTGVDQAGFVEVEVPDTAMFLWGIVAVDPESGRTWYRRFHLQGKPVMR